MATEQVVLLPRANRLLVLLQRGAKYSRKRPVVAFWTTVMLLVVLSAVLAPVFAPFEPNKQHYQHLLKPPLSVGAEGKVHLAGTDQFGRDQFSRLLYGARVSLTVSIIAVMLGTLVGSMYGTVSGYLMGKIDILMQRVSDAMDSIPTIVLAMLLVAIGGTNLLFIPFAIAFTQVPRTNRVVRSAVLAVREETYVEAARAVGAPPLRIILRHILPNVMAPILILVSLAVGAAIVIEATLSFLGLGVQLPNPSWGNMLAIEGRDYMIEAPWLFALPTVAISVTVLAFNFVGDALRDAWDPRLRGSR